MELTNGKRLFEMMKDDDMTDVTFLVQESEIPCHRNVASSRGGLLQELLQTNENRIEICNDVTPHTFKAVLEYIYTDECVISEEILHELLHAAKVLRLDDLDFRCAKAVKITEKDVGFYTEKALKLESKELLTVCEEYFKENTLKVISAKEFLEIPADVLEVFCNSGKIRCSEFQLFSACLEWAKMECDRQDLSRAPKNLRTVLEHVLPLIRFQAMSYPALLKFIVPLEILTDEEAGAIFVGKTKKGKRKRFRDDDRSVNTEAKKSLVVTGADCIAHSTSSAGRMELVGQTDQFGWDNIGRTWSFGQTVTHTREKLFLN